MGKKNRSAKLAGIALVLIIVIGVVLLFRMNREAREPTEGKDSLQTVGKPEGKKPGPDARDEDGDLTKPEEGDWLLQRTGYSISGQVVDERGRGLANAEVKVYDYQRFGFFDPTVVRPAKTDAEGNFRIRNLPKRTLFIKPVKEGHCFCLHGMETYGGLAQVYPVYYVPGKDRITDIRLVMRPGGVLAGKVLDHDDMPVANAAVRFVQRDYRRREIFELILKSDNEGRFRTSSLIPGGYQLSVKAQGFIRLQQDEMIDTDKNDLLIRLERAVSVSGNVVFAESGKPAPRAKVLIGRRASDDNTSLADEEGRFEVFITPHVKTDLNARWEDYVTAEVNKVFCEDGNPLSGVVLKLIKGGSISGSVSDEETGKPIEGIAVSTFPKRDVLRVSVQSDEDGRFALKGVNPGKRQIRARPDEYWPSGSIDVEVVGGKETTGVEIKLRRKSQADERAISGTVVDTEEKPVSGAFIVPETDGGIFDKLRNSAVSDANGMFVLQISRYRLRGLLTTHPQYAHKYLDFRKEGGPGKTSDIRIVLEKGGSIEGFVRGANGEPKRKIAVDLIFPKEYQPLENKTVRAVDFVLKTAFTREDGYYLLSGVAEGIYRVCAVIDRHQIESENLRISPGQKLSNINLTSAQAGEISGRVTDPQDSPIEGITVSASWYCKGIPQTACATTNSEGEYRISDLQEGRTYAVGAGSREYSRRSRNEVVCSARNVDLVLTRYQFCSVSGFVYRKSDGSPVKKFELTFLRQGGRSSGFVAEYRSEDGSFRRTRLLSGSYILKVTAPDFPEFESAAFDVGEGEEATQILYLPEGATIRGFVRRKSDETPIREFNICLLTSEIDPEEFGGFPIGLISGTKVVEWDEKRARVPLNYLMWIRSDDGSFRLHNTPPGTYVIKIQSQGLPDFISEPFDVREAEEMTKVIYIGEGGTISGHVRRESDGTPVETFYLTLIRDEGLVVREYRNRKYESDDGSFRCTKLRAGKYTIRIIPKGLPDFATEKIEVAENEETFHEIEIRDGGTIQGKVVDEAECGISGAAVEIAPTGWHAERRTLGLDSKTITDETGRFSLSNLTPGRITLSVTHPDYAEANVRNIPVTEGEPKDDIIIRLERGTLLHGWVKDVSGRKKDNVTLRFQSSGFRATTLTDDQGEFSFPRVPKGKASISIRYMRTTVRFKVTGEEEQETNIDFSQAGAISGKIHLPSEPENTTFIIFFKSCDEKQQNQLYSETNTAFRGDYSFRKEGLLPGKYKLELYGFRRVDGSRVRLNLTTSPAEIIVEISPKQKVTRDITVLEITEPE